MLRERRAMARIFTSMAALLVWISAVGASSVDDSIGQIRDTLQNLVASIGDAGQDTDRLFKARRHWCDATIHSLETECQQTQKSLAQLRDEDLPEREAAAQDAKGAENELKADIASEQSLLQESEGGSANVHQEFDADGQLIGALDELVVQNKHTALMSLRGKLELVLPAVATGEARVAEARRLIADRNETIRTSSAFVATLRSYCARASFRGAKLVAARAGEAQRIKAAIESLDSPPPEHGAESLDEDEEAAASEESPDAEGEALPDLQASSLLQRTWAERRIRSPRDVVPPKQIRQLLVDVRETLTMASKSPDQFLQDLKNTPLAGSKSAGWCADELAHAEVALKLAQDFASKSSAEVDAHGDVAVQLSEQLSRVKTDETALSAAVKGSVDGLQQERALRAFSDKREKLGSKIVAQAITVLNELPISDAASDVTGKLKAAQLMLDGHNSGADGHQNDAAHTLHAVRAMAHEAARALAREREDIELARGEHRTQRARSIRNQATHEAQVTEATVYMRKLKEECSPLVSAQEKRERDVEVRVLDDERKVLMGDQASGDRKASNGSLRGGGSSVAARKDLSPMERAAERMGVALD